MSATIDQQQSRKLRIIEPTEIIQVRHPIMLIYGQPGICKTSLAFSAENAILLNYDTESALARAVNRGRSINVLDVDQQEELQERADEVFAPFSTVAIDPIGSCVNLMAELVMKRTPKYGKGGNLTLQGYGQLKSDFRTWVTRLRTQRKNLLFVSHNKEDRNGSEAFNRPDITGASRDEVMRLSDCVGFLYMNGKERTLDFNPTEAWFGKNPAQWPAWTVPAPSEARTFMTQLFQKAREALSKASEASATVAQQVEDWRVAIADFSLVEEFNRAIPEILKFDAAPQAQVKKLLMERSVALGFGFDKTAKQFIAPVPTAQASW